MSICTRFVTGALVVASATRLLAGGSGLNVVVVVNTASTNSLQLGNYYCEKREVPPQNVLRINWPGSMVEWANAGGDYPGTLFNPLMAILAARGLTNQIDYVVLSMDIPYRVNGGFDYVNSTTSTLFYGFKPDTNSPFFCPIAIGSTNAYAGSESIFRDTPPISASSNSFLVTMITSSNLSLAKQIVDSGVLSDSTYPTQTVFLVKTSDPARNVRFTLFDNAIFNTRVLGNYNMARTNLDNPTNLASLLGLEMGRTNFPLTGTTFAPGAMADNLTSFGGFIFDPAGGQKTILEFLAAGAAGSYGTVVEPCAYPEKFPSPQNHFYQARGFSLAECYYQSVISPYEGLIVGEPLAAPFARPASGGWDNLATNAVLSGTTNVVLHFNASDAWHPIQQVDLFLDGVFYQTVTNIPPGMSNVLYVTINGFRTNYTVPTNATIKSVTSNLTSRLNGSAAYRNATKVTNYAHGDRIEVQSTNVNTLGNQMSISTSNYIGSAPVLTTFVRTSRTNCLDSVAWGIQGYYIGTGVTNNDVLTLSVTKTNGANVTVSVTNTTGLTDLFQFVQQFVNAINAKTSLQGSDGLVAEDLKGINPSYVHINLRAQSQGLRAAQIRVQLSGDFAFILDDFTIPSGAQKLDENLEDLQPRDHLYVTAGLTNLPVQFPFDTTAIADGWHELSAVAYEGSHVRTQTRISQTVLVQNTPLSAVFNCLACDVNAGLNGTLQFSVIANTNTIMRIELFSTGGSWGVVTNQSAASFSIPAIDLQLGLHPFYAIVTQDDGMQYRTETRWIRIGPSFILNIDGGGPTLSWQAQTGDLYEVYSATNVTGAYQLRDSLTATNPTAQWLETNDSAPQQFYRVRMVP